MLPRAKCSLFAAAAVRPIFCDLIAASCLKNFVSRLTRHNFFDCRWKPWFLCAAGKILHRAQSAHPTTKLIYFCCLNLSFSCNTSNNNNNFIPPSCVEINFRVHDTFTRALFWKIWLKVPSFMEKSWDWTKKQPKPPETIEFTQNTSKIRIQHA